MDEKHLLEIISEYRKKLHKKIEERKMEMEHDSTEHYLMYHALGFLMKKDIRLTFSRM